MVPMNIDKFVNLTVESNEWLDKKKFKSDLVKAVKRKKSGAKCIVCGNTIWAIGTAMCGWNGCFPCITGESDSSEDYEINSANF